MPRAAAALEVPLDIGVGPTAQWWTGQIGDEQPVHFGLKLSLAAVLDRDLIQRNLRHVPVRYRKMVNQVDEARYKPSIFIPDSLIISPKVAHTGIYGVTWRPVGFGMPLVRRETSLDISAGVLLTYAFLHSDGKNLPFTSMHFLRPGLDLTLRWEIPVLPDAFLLALGWSSQFYVPQRLGGGIFEAAVLGAPDTIWHIGQAFLTLHWRVPYDVKM